VLHLTYLQAGELLVGISKVLVGLSPPWKPSRFDSIVVLSWWSVEEGVLVGRVGVLQKNHVVGQEQRNFGGELVGRSLFGKCTKALGTYLNKSGNVSPDMPDKDQIDVWQKQFFWGLKKSRKIWDSGWK
jgi:hypothetical protein